MQNSYESSDSYSLRSDRISDLASRIGFTSIPYLSKPDIIPTASQVPREEQIPSSFLEKKIKDLNEKIISLEAMNKATSEDFHSLQQKSNQLDKENLQLKNTLQKFQSECNEADETHQHFLKLESLQVKAYTLENENLRKETHIQALENSLKEALKVNSKISLENEQLLKHTNSNDLSLRIEALETQKQQFKQQVAALKDQENKLRTSNEALNKKYKTAKKGLKQIQQDFAGAFDSLKKELQSAKSINEKLVQEIKETRNSSKGINKGVQTERIKTCIKKIDKDITSTARSFIPDNFSNESEESINNEGLSALVKAARKDLEVETNLSKKQKKLKPKKNI